MTYEEAYNFLIQQQSEIMSAQMMGRGTYPSKAMEAGFVLLPFAKKYNETRAEIASRVFVQLLSSDTWKEVPVSSLIKQAVSYADELMKVLTENT